MDCHTEISHYDPRQPKGNKFRDDELRARRDQVYALVEKGVLQAQIVAQHIRHQAGPGRPDAARLSAAADALRGTATEDAHTMLRRVKSLADDARALARKFRLLTSSDAAFVVDSLARDALNDDAALEGLCRVLDAGMPDRGSAEIVLEQVVRRLTLSGSVERKIIVTVTCAPPLLQGLPEPLRSAFFEDLFDIVDRDVFRHVNPLVPALVRHVAAIPAGLHQRYVLTLLTQSRSRATTGSRSARDALRDLPGDIVLASLPAIDAEYLGPIDRYRASRAFLRHHEHLLTAASHPMLRDLIDLPDYTDFWQRYIRPLHAEVTVEASASAEPSSLQKRVLEVVAEAYLRTGNSSLRRVVQLELDSEPRAAVADALAASTPAWLRRTAEFPEEQYVPTLRGVLLTSYGPAASEFAMQVVDYLRGALRRDRTMGSYTSEALGEALGEKLAPPVPFMSAVITLVKLGGGGGGSGRPLSSFHVDVPPDVVSLIDCRTFDEVLALRRHDE